MTGAIKRIRSGSGVLLLAAFASSLPAQSGPPDRTRPWSLGISVGSAAFAAGARGASPETDTLRFFPTRTTLWGLSARYGPGPFRVEVAVRRGHPGLGIRGADDTDLLLIGENAYLLTLLSVGASTHVLTLRGGPTLRSSLAVDVERWTGAGSPARTIAGGQAGVTMEVMLTRAFVATLDAELGWSPRSPFRKEDVPDGFRLRPTWRRALSGGIAWRI